MVVMAFVAEQAQALVTTLPLKFNLNKGHCH